MHHVCVVLCPEGTTLGTAEAAVEPLLAPYDESLEVPEHEAECACVATARWIAHRDGLKAALGDFQSAVRMPFEAAHEADYRRIAGLRGRAKEEAEAEVQRAWEATFDARKTAEAAWYAANPVVAEADPECEDCQGSGVVRTTANPRGHWDWYQVGGRYSSWLGYGITGNYDPEKDPANRRTCNVCHGTGDRPGMVRYEPDDVTHRAALTLANALVDEAPRTDGRIRVFADENGADANGCDGCQGDGTRMEWPTELKATGQDCVPAGLLVGRGKIPGALVTPDGEHHARETWDGVTIVVDEDWAAKVEAWYAAHPACVAVAVDCHN
jgi:hypothetical protein